MSELVCCRRQRPLDDTKLSKTALFCFVLGVAIVKGEGISRSLGLFNVKKCETRVFKTGCAGNLPNAHGLGCSWESLFLQGLEKVTVKTLRPFLPHSPCWGRACVIQVCRFLPPLSANRARAQGTPGSALPCLLGLCCSRVDCPGCPTPAGFLRPVLPQPEEGLSRVREENLPKTLESKGPQILTKHFLGNSTPTKCLLWPAPCPVWVDKPVQHSSSPFLATFSQAVPHSPTDNIELLLCQFPHK